MPEAPYPTETHEEHDAHNLFMLRRLTDRAFGLAEMAADRVEAHMKALPPPSAEPDPPPSRYVAVFDRCCHLVRSLIALAHRITHAKPPKSAEPRPDPAKPAPEAPRVKAPDLVTAMIRDPLAAAARAEPDRAAREKLYKHIDARIAAERADRPDAKPVEILETIAAELGVTVEYKNLPDAMLGMPPRIYPDAPPGWVPPVDPRLAKYLKR